VVQPSPSILTFISSDPTISFNILIIQTPNTFKKIPSQFHFPPLILKIKCHRPPNQSITQPSHSNYLPTAITLTNHTFSSSHAAKHAPTSHCAPHHSAGIGNDKCTNGRLNYTSDCGCHVVTACKLSVRGDFLLLFYGGEWKSIMISIG
jgi:hypothetical protein